MIYMTWEYRGVVFPKRFEIFVNHMVNPVLKLDPLNEEGEKLGVAACGCDECLKALEHPCFAYNFEIYLKKRDKQAYCYLFTFTRDPSKKKSKEEMLTWVKDIRDRKDSLGIIEMWYVEEHKDTNYHIHVALKTLKPVKTGVFQYYSKVFGTYKRDIQVLGKTLDEMVNYMSKESIPIKQI